MRTGATATGATGWTWRRLFLHGKPGVPAVGIDGEQVFSAGWDGSVGRWNAAGALVAQYHPPQPV